MKITKRMYTQMVKHNGGGFYWDTNGEIDIFSHGDLKFYKKNGKISERNFDAILSLEDGMTLKGSVCRPRNPSECQKIELTGDFDKFAPVLHEIHAFCEIIDNKYAIVALNDEQKKALEELKTLARKQTK